MRHLARLTHLPVLAALCAASAWAQADYPERVGPPASMAALGDSITRAVNTSGSGLGERPALSWSTGTDGGIVSHYTQLDALGDPPVAYNLAVSGARMSGIGTQVANAIARDPEYVTLLMGANDACRDTEALMTPVLDYRAQFEAAIDALSGGLPDSRIFVVSVPDVYVLWEVLHTDSTAVSRWNSFGICQSLLANPTSTAQADVDRRANVRQRVIDFNTQLEEVCAEYIHCRYDQGGVFANSFTAADVSLVDYFHPSLAGQIRLGTETWPATFDFTDVLAPVTTVEAVAAGADDQVTLTATDDVAVRGIEYRYDGDARWTRYDAPLTVPGDETLTFRAVDVNGNIEAGQTYKRGEVLADAGTGTDAGTDGSDAGTDGSDAGTDPGGGTDGGIDDPDPNTGCSCDVTGVIPMAAFGVLGLTRFRRRRRS